MFGFIYFIARMGAYSQSRYNAAKQQNDLSILNGKLMEEPNLLNYIENKSGKSKWATFYVEIKSRL